MNANTSTTGIKVSERLANAKLPDQWKSINWKRAETEVNRLQTRIAKAAQGKRYNKVKQLQYLLTHSYYAKTLAVRKVTSNKGKNTPGVDKELWTTPASKMEAVLKLTDRGYNAKPLRRVYIDKKGKKSKRPLGIPTIYDRAMQALYALALDPVSEVTADKKSFGFRKGRCCQDACDHIFTVLSRSFSAQWVLEGDIRGCFDNVSHNWLIENIPMDKSVLKQFLKAGYVFKGELFPTENGTPQGGCISPIFANMALDGMQAALTNKFGINTNGKISAACRSKNKVNLVRYADDFIVTAASEEIAREGKEVIREFLLSRGLELSEEKTCLTHIDDGFDLLGWTFRKFKGKLIIKPSKKSTQNFVASLSETILKRGKACTQEALIRKLNAQIRGWTNYHQAVAAKKTFSHIDHYLFEVLYKWAKRRHPKKNHEWIVGRYWHRVGSRSWVFSTEKVELLLAAYVPIIRHAKVRMDANPYFDAQYFIDRKFENGMKKLSGRFKNIWKNQKGCCFHCGMPMEISDNKKIFLKVPKSQGGKDVVNNMAYVHEYCNTSYFERRSKE